MIAVQVIGHRGFSAAAPENTLASIEAAIEAGADAVEFDVHTAACGTPILFHDTMLSRTTNGVGPIRRRTLAQLRSLDAGSWFGPDFAGVGLPSLQEALDACRGRLQRVYVEVKGFRELEDLDRMVDIAQASGLLEDVVFIAMNWTVLDRMRSCAPDLHIGYIVDEAERADEAIERAGGDHRSMLDFDARILLADPAMARRAVDEGIALAVWTVNDADDARRLVDMGVGAITTDQVDRMVAWRAGAQA